MIITQLKKYLSRELVYSLAVVPILALVDSTSIFSYYYALTIIVTINILVKNSDWNKTLFHYHYYLFWGIIVFLSNKYQLPAYIGTTGPEGIGTDDYTFYGQIVEGEVPYLMEVPAEYKYPFSIFLQAVYPFHIYTPLNVVLFNIVFASYMPYFTGKLAEFFFNDPHITNIAQIMVLLCPMTTLYGVIIIRDLLVTTLVLASIFYYLNKNYISVIICVALVFFIRFGSISFIAASFLVIYIIQNANSGWGWIKTVTVFSIFIITFLLFLPTLQEYSDGKLSANLIRAVDGEYYEGSTIASIVSLPFPINIILSSLFYAFAPLLGFPSLHNGVFVIINFFNATLTPIYFMIIAPFLFNPFFEQHKSTSLKISIYLLLTFLVVLGTVSLQIRHKNIIFPVMSIIAAYGFIRFNKKNAFPTKVLMVITVITEISYAIYSL